MKVKREKAHMIAKEDSEFVYYIDREKRTIVAKLTVSKYDHYKSVLKSPGNNMGFFSANPYDTVDYLTYVGKATCSPEDVFNTEFGMKLAQKRALAKYYKKRAEITTAMRDNLYKLYENAKKIADYNISKKEKFEKED